MSIRIHRLQEPRQSSAEISRRMFLMTTAMAGVTTSAFLSSPAFAAALNESESATLLRMAQDIYPHPNLLGISHYKAIADTVISNAGGNADMAAALRDGLKRINEAAKALFGTSYVEIKDPNAREGLLRRFQNEGFFQGVRWTAYFAIYNNKDVWPKFGYQGSSAEHGGYIDRGFSDITFVPQGPTLEERMAAVKTGEH